MVEVEAILWFSILDFALIRVVFCQFCLNIRAQVCAGFLKSLTKPFVQVYYEPPIL